MHYSLLKRVKTLACLAGTRLGDLNIQTGQLAGHEKLAHTECQLTTEDLNSITHSSQNSHELISPGSILGCARRTILCCAA